RNSSPSRCFHRAEWTDRSGVFLAMGLQMNTFNNVSPPSCSWSAEELSSVKSTTDADCTNLQNEAMPGNVLANNASPLKKRNPNQCTFCLKTFDFPSKLSRHLRIHTGLRPYECHVCHKSFKQLSHLQCHQWVHNRAYRLRKSYQCAVCFKSFEAPSKLKRHYLIHTGQRPYQCTMCNKAYTQSAHLKTHMFSHR
uniref:C2H2-type domain-containing protein n=1 Tax=Astyanax mexicanus TaxID=7994 RepID=A0A3B1KFV8_ASTMX